MATEYFKGLHFVRQYIDADGQPAPSMKVYSRTECKHVYVTPTIRAIIGLQKLDGNEHAYWSVTGNVTPDGTSGAIGDTIERNFADVPEIVDACRWHLVDEPGTPMHYEANARYWAEYVMNLSDYQLPDSRTAKSNFADYSSVEALQHFKSTVVFGAVDTDEATLPAVFAPLSAWNGKPFDCFDAAMTDNGRTLFDEWPNGDGILAQYRIDAVYRAALKREIAERIKAWCQARADVLAVTFKRDVERVFEIREIPNGRVERVGLDE